MAGNPSSMIARMAKLVAWFAEAFTSNELHAYAGLAMLAYGFNVMLAGAGWAAAGAVLLWLGVRR